MQTKQSNIWAVKEEPESNIVVLDDAALDEAQGCSVLLTPAGMTMHDVG